MKLRCEILKVGSDGDSLEIQVQGTTVGAADWRNWKLQTLTVPMTKTAARSLYVGRTVEIDIKPL